MLRAVSSQYEQQQAIAATTGAAVNLAWSRMGDDFDASWRRVGPDVLGLVDAGRGAAVREAFGYTAAVLEETNQTAPPVGDLSPNAFLSSTPDGRSVAGLYEQAVIGAKESIADGASVDDALAQSGRWMQMATLTLLADTRRMVYEADIASRPALTGYVRMLNMPSCGRCIPLAGKWYRWNDGFKRHERCDCTHIPASENIAGSLVTDPYAAFDSMTEAEQDRAFGRSEARALREGADMYAVMNQKIRKLSTARSQIDTIYRTAGTRTNAVRMLRERGFIKDRGRVVVPRSPGVRTDAQILAAGRGKGTVRIGGQTVTTARASRYDAVASGRRDPLNRSTMTAGERRLYDAHYRLAYAQRNGRVPRSIGPSSADVYANAIEATPAKLAELRRAYEAQLAAMKDGAADGVRRVADALGIKVTAAGVRSPLTGGAGAGGIEPPRRGGPPLPPPDPSDRDAWRRYWQNRQDALALDTGGDRLEPQEIQFLERFLVSNQVRWIPRDPNLRPTNDFVWINEGDLTMELKSTGAKYQSIRNHIHTAVAKATRGGVVKENFIVDLGDGVLTDKLRRQLAEFNQRTSTTPIRRLFVMSRDGLEEIRLL
ncbi:hypothetical protein [Microbacterium sp.]|uniref:hypothetical protein n=1 Tax=Microbacterium sp. TaxID=51671 RepID=UPI0039E46ECE